MLILPRHVYFDEDGTARPMSQARLARVRSSHTREAVPELAGRRVRFLTLYVRFEDGIPIELSQTEASIIPFDDEGRRDQAAASVERRSAVALLEDDDEHSPSGIISAETRFQRAGFSWRPTRAEIEAALAVHGVPKL